MNKSPSEYTLQQVLKLNYPSTIVLVGNDWMPARPEGFYGLSHRFKLALKVFTGKADIFTWPGGQ